MRRKRYLKILFCICIILSWKYCINNNEHQQPMIISLESLHNYNLTLRDDAMFDTYYHRIQQFLDGKNMSIFSYEETDVVNDVLQQEIEIKINEFRSEQIQEILNIKNDQELDHGCEQLCCWSRRKIENYYNGEKDHYASIIDRLSRIDMKLLADLHYGNLPIPDGIRLPKLTSHILPCLQNNTVIFVDTLQLDRFFKEIHEKISVNYILITGDSDISCPYRIRRSNVRLLDKIFAGQTRIIHWFAMNCNLGNNEQWKNSKIFSCIPQGINQWTNHRYYMQLASGKDDSICNTDLKVNDYWVLTAFNLAHGSKYRQPLWELSCQGRLKNISKCLDRSHSIDPWKYFIRLAQSKFVFSPPGDSIDSYRTWEALYLGSIPIVINSSLNSVYQDLPVLIVNNYEEITLEFLETTYTKMINQTYDYRRLYKGYWQRKINDYRNSSELIQFSYTISR